MRESIVVLEQKSWLRRKRSPYVIPVDRIRKINVEIRHDGLPLPGHVSRRRKIRLLNVLQLANERLFWRTTRTGIPFDGSLVDHDRKRKSRMGFRFHHHQFRGLVNAVVRTVPVDNHSVDTAADHIGDLPMDLFRVGGAVSDIHVVRSAKPQQQMGVNFRSGSGIEQIVNVDFTDIADASVPVALG